MPEISLVEIKKDLADRKSMLLQRKGARDQLKRDLASESSSAAISSKEATVASEAHLWVLTEIVERRGTAMATIESTASSVIEAIYGPDNGLRFETYDDKRAKGDSNFKMEVQYITPYEADGYEGDSAAISFQGGTGGGAQESSGTWLRVKALDWLKYRGPVIIDEGFAALSRDGKLDEIANLLRAYANQTGRQVIIATHMVDVFGPIADCILRVVKSEKGCARVESTPGAGASVQDGDWSPSIYEQEE